MCKNFMIFLVTKVKNYLSDESGEVGFMGGGTTDGGDTTGGTTDGGTSDDAGGIQYSYPDGFDEKLRGDASLIKFADEKGNFNHAAIMKSYVHAQGMMGKDKMGVPDDTWTDDQYKELYTRLGRPEDIKEYNIENNVSKGIDKNDDFFNSLKETAYTSGLNPKQAQSMSDFFNNFVGESVAKNGEMAQAQAAQAEGELKQDWGEKYEYKTNRAFTALQEFASPEELKGMQASGLLQNTSIVRLFDKIADGMAEDSLKVKGAQTFGMTGEEAGREIESYYTKGHPFITRGHPEQRFYQEKMQKLQRIKLSSKRS